MVNHKLRSFVSAPKIAIFCAGLSLLLTLSSHFPKIFGAQKNPILPPTQQLALQDLQLPSSIPNLRLGAKRQMLYPVDLRLAQIALAIEKEDNAATLKPLTDSVLVTPRTFLKMKS